MGKYATSCVYDSLYGCSSNMKGGAMTTKDVMDLLYSKKEFMLKVFATLVTQLGITYYIMTRYEREKDKDKIVPIKASENISKLENVKFIIVENSKHEILNQDTRTFVLSEIHYWFKENNLI